MSEFIAKNFWTVLPFEKVKNTPGLRLSPLGVVPQRDRRPRLIVDYTFSDVNQETQEIAPPESMQFGRALDRILMAVLKADASFGHVYLSKIDFADGFYRINVHPDDVAKLGVIMPTRPGESTLIAFPLGLPMGWTESPPWFSAATETIIDLANDYCGTSWDPPPHVYEALASTMPGDLPTDRIICTIPVVPPGKTFGGEIVLPPRPRQPTFRLGRKGPAMHADVFVDDEIVAAQGSRARLNRIRRQLMHLNDMVFRPNDLKDQEVKFTPGAEAPLPTRAEPQSEKKFQKGDACWTTYKTVLGWNIDTVRGTIELPEHRKNRLRAVLQEVSHRRRITQKHAQTLLGELRSMAIGIPGSAGLFSLLQQALTTALHKKNRVKLDQPTRDHIKDLNILANSLATRPTRIAELFPSNIPHGGGTTDACGHGLGGALFPSPTIGNPPTVWRTHLPKDIRKQLITEQNPGGTVTIGDLELAATVIQDTMWAAHDINERTLLNGSDNMGAVVWRHKGSNSLRGPSAYLLREASLLQRQHRHITRQTFIPGTKNQIADIASRRFDLTDEQLLTHLNSLAPQTTSWVMLPPPPEALLNVISALRMQRPERQWAAIEPRPPTPSGNNVGYHSFPTSTSPTLTSPASTTKSQSFGCLPKDSGSEHYPAVTSLSELRMYATKFYVSQRSSPNWGPKTLDSPQPVIWTQGSPLSTKDGQTKTRHHGVSNPCRYPSSITPQTIKSGRMQLPTAPSTWPGLPSFTYSDQVNTANPKTTPL